MRRLLPLIAVAALLVGGLAVRADPGTPPTTPFVATAPLATPKPQTPVLAYEPDEVLVKMRDGYELDGALAWAASTIAMAAVDGYTGEPGLYRDYLLRQIMQESILSSPAATLLESARDGALCLDQ